MFRPKESIGLNNSLGAGFSPLNIIKKKTASAKNLHDNHIHENQI
jgi:hypothetical protein